tara:strand:+ start:1424 stop:2614 length:1191 start_codon:yes stop_codon:yes gene_type:complete
MVDVKISELGELTSVASSDVLAIVDDPSGTPVSKKVTVANLLAGLSSVDADSTTISNLEVDNFKASAIVIESEGISSNDNDTTIPTSASVKDYVDSQIATEDTIAELNDTTITSVGDNELLQYDSTSSTWINQTLAEAGIQGALTFGIADNNAVEIDGSGTASGEYAKFTANGIVGEEVADVKTDLSLNNVENTALSTWAGTSNITTLGTIATGTWEGTDVGITHGGTGASTAQAGINALTAVSSATNEHVLTKDTSTGNAIWKATSTVGAINDLSDVTITGASKGDIVVYNGSAWVDLTVGSNGLALKADSSTATGLTWGTAGGATLLHTYTNSTSTSALTNSSNGVAYDVGTTVASQASGSGNRDIYIRKIDTNNEGVFALVHKNGSIVEVQVA